MSPTSKSKSKDRKSSKEAPKSSLKPPVHVNISSETPTSGYNPVLGTFHTIETAPLPSIAPLHVNGRFRNIDDADDHNGNSPGTGTEYDSISNNGSWSGESEDHKEKSSQPLLRQDSVPGADNDKREKIRQKNERKHQRQKERRAQELHERCNGYLMSRKLEALARQLVAMGFSQERATMALILNEGRVEESVAWLLEGGEEGKKIEHNLDGGSNLKIDISVELVRITELQLRYKASKQEVERAIVSCEGDLDKAEDTIKTQKEEPPAVPSKFQENGDPPTVVNSKLPVSISQSSSRIQQKPTSSIQQQKMDDKNLNYTKVPPTIGFSVDPGAKTVQLLKKIPPKTDWAKPQQIAAPVEKRSASFSSTSSLPSSIPAKTDPSYVAVGHELKNLQLGSVKEPVIVMQRPQSINNAKQGPSTSISQMGWYPSSVETAKPNGFMSSVALCRSISPNPSPSPSPNGFGSNQFCSQPHYQPSQQQCSMDSTGTKRGNGFRSQNGSPSLAPPSSLGLFCGIGPTGTSSSRVDWSTGCSMLQFDYSSVDWSVDRRSLFSRPEGMWTGANYIQDNSLAYESSRRPSLVNGGSGGASMVGLQDGLSVKEPIGAGSREWSSPFEEKELFNIPREIVAYPSL